MCNNEVQLYFTLNVKSKHSRKRIALKWKVTFYVMHALRNQMQTRRLQNRSRLIQKCVKSQKKVIQIYSTDRRTKNRSRKRSQESGTRNQKSKGTGRTTVDRICEPWCVTGGLFSDCVVDSCMTVFAFHLRFSPSPFGFVCYLDFYPCIPHDSDSCPALMICSPWCLTRFWPYSTTLTVILFFCSPYSDSGKVRVSPAGLHPSNGTLFVILSCYFSFVVFEGYPGRRCHLCWELATSPLRARQAFED